MLAAMEAVATDSQDRPKVRLEYGGFIVTTYTGGGEAMWV